jgi:predicted DCC family thiol-disulfide oxidoreductase YuxK
MGLTPPRERPVLVYDGDCGFCTTCARFLERIGPDAEIVAWQLTDLAELGVTEEQAADAVQWVAVDGSVRSGHEAIAAVLNSAGRIWRIAGRLIVLPGVSWLAARAYRLTADNRYRLPGRTPACARPPAGEPGGGPTEGAP